MAATMDVSRAEQQLAAIASLSGALDERGLEYWLFGGWAVDFWVGSITRDHDDIDVAARQSDQDAIKAALLGLGWRHTPAVDEVVGTRYQLGGVEAEFTFVVPDADGRIFIPFDQPLMWSAEPFGSDRRELLGVSCRTISLRLLTEGKRKFVDKGRAEAAKDRADYEALAKLQGMTSLE
jgi:Aminoglycoside-2''-adenylyltransferase